MSDQKLLSTLLNCGKLSEEEEEAFRGMLSRLEGEHRNTKTLSDRQRKWANAVYVRLKLADDEPCQNLYSQGIGRPGRPLPSLGYELMPRPLKPPGR